MRPDVCHPVGACRRRAGGRVERTIRAPERPGGPGHSRGSPRSRPRRPARTRHRGGRRARVWRGDDAKHLPRTAPAVGGRARRGAGNAPRGARAIPRAGPRVRVMGRACLPRGGGTPGRTLAARGRARPRRTRDRGRGGLDRCAGPGRIREGGHRGRDGQGPGSPCRRRRGPFRLSANERPVERDQGACGVGLPRAVTRGRRGSSRLARPGDRDDGADGPAGARGLPVRARRGRGARGDLEGAEEHLQRSLAEHARTQQPFELGRTLLVAGAVQRRMRRKRGARDLLEEALTTFDEVGAPLWANRTRRELARIGGRAPTSTGLTPTEAQIAHLVAEGRTNSEVADALFVSVHTVEANLKRIYRKLDVRSRTELARKL